MQISSFSISPSVTPLKATSSSPSAPHSSTDTADTSFTTSADSFSSLVQQAGETPDVRSDLVDSFKFRISSGQYPTSDTIDSLADAIGGGIVKMADSSQD